MQQKLIVIQTLEESIELCKYLNTCEFIAYDTETTGTDKDSKIIGISVAADDCTGYYVILSKWNVVTQQLEDLPTITAIKPILEVLKTKNLIMHNGVFDCWMTYNNFQVSLIESLHTDTMILSHLLDENNSVGLKELGERLFGEDTRKEQIAMKESVTKNGGVPTKNLYELYKADAELIGYYGAKDAILTMRLFYHQLPSLFDQKLDSFFYKDECMPLLRGPTYQMNTTGLRIDPDKLMTLRGELESEIMELKALIYKDVIPLVQDKYKCTLPSNTFNITAPQQLSWLLFEKLENEFFALTDSGRELCTALELKVPYDAAAKREFIRICKQNAGREYQKGKYNPKTKKVGRPKKVEDYWKYIAVGKKTLAKLSKRYKWVERLLEYKKNTKLLSTYVIGIQSLTQYNIIRPSFLQHGTTSGRYSSKRPNFQNLPRKDKRVKSCVVARPGMVFVGADYSQLEPRVFASVSQDETLLECFASGKDFYSVVGMPIFDRTDCSEFKEGKDAFATKYPADRDLAKAFALATPYGTSAFRQAQELDLPTQQCHEIIRRYFESYPKVEEMMLASHEMAKKDGVVYSLYGRPRRIPEAMSIPVVCGPNTPHGELPYLYRTMLNLGMNHRVQSSAASIMNRAAIAVYRRLQDEGFSETRIILQVHDELILECLETQADQIYDILKDCMENTTILPGVKLIAEPKVAKNLADLK